MYNCKIAMANDDIDNLDNSKIVSTPHKKCYYLWSNIMNLGMKIFKQKSFKVDRPLRNNQIINKYGINLKIISLPGHTNGSIGILYKNFLFAGDALVNRKKYPEPAYQNQNNKSADESYRKILEIKPNTIFVGHDKEFNISKLKEYLLLFLFPILSNGNIVRLAIPSMSSSLIKPINLLSRESSLLSPKTK